ncbi:MAG: L-2-amino-thiazoline-4-carboxylic acid hydrolase [Candidatus Aminicenantes bacterium]|nr:L-2-amino-thiazoline-4-carboxylic acid hydrolase [Candidatus Aminicenantes bacterium]
MKRQNVLSGFDRRRFLTTLMPACALTCLGARNVLGSDFHGARPVLQEAKHKFDAPFDRPLTYRQLFGARYGEFIQLAKALEKEMGREKLLDFLKKNTEARLFQLGQQQAKQSPDQTFSTYVKTFRGPAYDKTLTMQIVEDSDKVFELKVTECLWASVFLQAKAGEIGYAAVCFGDYAWAQGFNSKIRMVRDKTLMQGHDCCNHRYVWEG